MCILCNSNRTAYSICLQVGDRSGELTARLNLSDLQMVLGLSYSTNNSMMSESHVVDNSFTGTCLFLQYFLTVNFKKNLLFAWFSDNRWLSMQVWGFLYWVGSPPPPHQQKRWFLQYWTPSAPPFLKDLHCESQVIT